MIFFQRHHAVLTDASRAASRVLVLKEYWSAFREIPSGKICGDPAHACAGAPADAILPVAKASARKGAIVAALCDMNEADIARAIRVSAGAGAKLSTGLTGTIDTAFTASRRSCVMRRRHIMN